MNCKINGTIKTIHELTEFESKSGESFKKQIFTVVNNDGYEGKEQVFAIELFGDKADILKAKEGDEVTVEANLACRHWKEDKYFTTLQGWKIDSTKSVAQKASELPDDRDLPF